MAKEISFSEQSAKMRYPLVSIIIPTYNYGHYLADAIESCLRQTYPNIEVIVIDDGSTDHTKNIVKHYPVQYFYQRNQGVAVAMNNGIKLSHGEFFVSLSADDKFAPEYIQKTIELILKDPRIGFVHTGSKLWNEELQLENIRMPRKIRNKYDIFRFSWVGPLGTVLTRKTAFDSLGDGYDKSLLAHEDVDFCFRLCLKGWKTAAVFQPLHWYRIHKKSRNPKTIQKAKCTLSFLDKKFPSRKALKRFNTFCMLPLCSLILFMKHPMEYFKGIKRKIKIKLWTRSFPLNSAINREIVFELFHEIWLSIDLLVEWYGNTQLRKYYNERLRTLESRLQKILTLA